jgi:hypothetical protein
MQNAPASPCSMSSMRARRQRAQFGVIAAREKRPQKSVAVVQQETLSRRECQFHYLARGDAI